MSDILFHQDDYIFSYRVAGILVRDGKVLLQKPTNSHEYAFSGGHVAFGETHEETLRREWKEEIGADISVGELKWVEENIFPWSDKTVHQICLDYLVTLDDESQIPLDGSFPGIEHIEGRGYDIHFHWIPIEQVQELTVYPVKAAELLPRLNEDVKHFVYREK